MIYRKFGWLRGLVLLDLQDQIVELEESLVSLFWNQDEHGQKKRLMSRQA